MEVNLSRLFRTTISTNLGDFLLESKLVYVSIATMFKTVGTSGCRQVSLPLDNYMIMLAMSSAYAKVYSVT